MADPNRPQWPDFDRQQNPALYDQMVAAFQAAGGNFQEEDPNTDIEGNPIGTETSTETPPIPPGPGTQQPGAIPIPPPSLPPSGLDFSPPAPIQSPKPSEPDQPSTPAGKAAFGEVTKALDEAVPDDTGRLTTQQIRDATRPEAASSPASSPAPTQSSAINFTPKVMGYIDDAVALYPNVPKDVLKAIIKVESNGNPDAISYAPKDGPVYKKGDPIAYGLMQTIPSTFKEQGVGNDIMDPAQNVMAGAKYLSGLIDQFKDPTTGKPDLDRVFASYNAGAGAVKKAGDDFNSITEPGYVSKVKSYLGGASTSSSASTPSVAQAPAGPETAVERYQRLNAQIDKLIANPNEMDWTATKKDLGDLRASLASQQALLMNGAEVGRKQFEMQQGALEEQNRLSAEYQKQAQADVLERQKMFQDYKVKHDTLTTEFASTKIDPDRYWRTRTTGQKVGSVIGAILGGIGAGLQHSSRNIALDMLQKSVDDDVRAQMAEVQIKHQGIQEMDNSYAEGLKAFNDVAAAKLFAQQIGLQMVDRKLQAASMGLRSEAQKNQALIAGESLQQQGLQIQSQLDQRMDSINNAEITQRRQQLMGQLVAGRANAFLEVNSPDSAELENWLAKYPEKGPNSISPKVRDKAREELGTNQELMHQVDVIDEKFGRFQKAGMAGRMNPTNFKLQQEIRDSYDLVFNAVRTSMKGERFTDDDRKQLVDTFRPERTDTGDTLLQKSKDLKQFLITRSGTPTLERLGFKGSLKRSRSARQEEEAANPTVVDRTGPLQNDQPTGGTETPAPAASKELPWQPSTD